MRHTCLGPTGLKVSELCLGTMTFGTDWGWGADEEECRRILDAYADAGGNFVDTANVYTDGASETFLGRLLAGRRDRFVLATKYTIGTDRGDQNAWGNGRKTFMAALEASLRRLGTDRIDLYYAHLWDGATPVEETMRAMEDAVRQGKVLHAGLSDVPAWLVARADALAEAARAVRPAAIQVEYNLAARDAERELVPMATQLGLSVLAWSPLAGGVLTGKTLGGGDGGRVSSGAVAHFDKYRTEAARAVARAVVDLAREVGRTPAQVAVAWLRALSPLNIPIIGGRSLAQVADTLGALDVRLDAEAMGRLDAASAAPLGFPMDFLRAGRARWFDDGPARLDPRPRPDPRRLLAG